MKGRPHGSNLELFYHFKYRPKESPMKTYYVGMDVHRATIALALLNGAGKVVMESTIETGQSAGGFLKQLHSARGIARRPPFTYRTGGGSDLAVPTNTSLRWEDPR